MSSSLPQVNYGLIQYDSGFHKHLEGCRDDKIEGFILLQKMRRVGFKGLTASEQNWLKERYDFFVKVKEHWFPHSTPQCRQITRQEIDNWLMGSCGRRIYLEKHPNCYNKDVNRAAAKLVERIAPLLEKLAKRMPAVVYNLIYNRPDFKFVIVPGDGITVLGPDGKEKTGAAGYSVKDDLMILPEEAIMGDDIGSFNDKVTHEFYHAFDFITADTTTTITTTDWLGRKQQNRYSRRLPNTDRGPGSERPSSYSDILNEQLVNLKRHKGEKIAGMAVKTLDEIVAEENEKMRAFNKLHEQLAEKANDMLECSNVSNKEALDTLNKEVAKAKKQMGVWMPTFHTVERDPGLHVCVVGADYRMDRQELLAYSVQAYYNGGAAEIKKYNPLLYHLLVNKIIPALKNDG